MPTTLRTGAYRFYFYSYDCYEPKHTHVDRDDKMATFWLEPVVRLSDNHGFNAKELRKIEQIINDNREVLINGWDNFCRNISSKDYER